MALTPGDKAECKEIAREIIEHVLTEHIKACPHGIRFMTSRAYLMGICIGSGLAGGIAGGGIAEAITKLFGS